MGGDMMESVLYGALIGIAVVVVFALIGMTRKAIAQKMGTKMIPPATGLPLLPAAPTAYARPRSVGLTRFGGHPRCAEGVHDGKTETTAFSRRSTPTIGVDTAARASTASCGGGVSTSAASASRG